MNYEEYFKAKRYIDYASLDINSGRYKQAISNLNKAKRVYPKLNVGELQGMLYIMYIHDYQKEQLQTKSSRYTSNRSLPTKIDFKNKNSPKLSNMADKLCESKLKYEFQQAYENVINQGQHNIHGFDFGKTNSAPKYPKKKSANTIKAFNRPTKKDIEMVKRINSCMNFYQVLNVPSGASTTDIKKAYRKLALQLHPDKNRAPGSDDAFKTVGQAVTVLSDTNLRKSYDQISSKTIVSTDLLAEEMKFDSKVSKTSRKKFSDENDNDKYYCFQNTNADLPPRPPYEYANQRQPQIYDFFRHKMAITFVITLIMIAIFVSMYMKAPLYSFIQTSVYSVPRETRHLSIPYFVTKNFVYDYQGSLSRFDHNVENDFIWIMKQQCKRERNYRELMTLRARNTGSREQYKLAQNIKTPACSELSKLSIDFYSY